MSRTLGDQVLDLRACSRRLVRAGPALRARGARRTAEAVATACGALLEPRGALGRAFRQELRTNTGLSAASIAWGLETTLRTWRVDQALALRAAAPSEPGAPPALAAIVLAGNVFTAGLRAIAWPLMAGVPVIAKASSTDDVLPRYLEKALHDADADVGAALRVATFARGEAALEAALLGHADIVSVHGDDDTVAALRARAPAHARFLAHGHGVGVAYVAAAALTSEASALAAAERVALDVAAYDQRGCLSPHAVVVDAGAAITPARFAELLADVALANLEPRLPRGEVPRDALAAQTQWRGVALARGTLHAGARWAVSFEDAHALRASPGYRNVGVYTGHGPDALAARIATFAPHVKALGIAGPEAASADFAALAPYVCAAGAMQTPPLGARLDGLQPFEGFVRRPATD